MQFFTYFAHSVSKLVGSMPALTSRCPSHGSSFVLTGLHAAPLCGTTDSAIGTGFEFVGDVSDGARGGGCFHYFLSPVTDGTDCLLRNFFARPARTIFVVFVLCVSAHHLS